MLSIYGLQVLAVTTFSVLTCYAWLRLRLPDLPHDNPRGASMFGVLAPLWTVTTALLIVLTTLPFILLPALLGIHRRFSVALFLTDLNGPLAVGEAIYICLLLGMFFLLTRDVTRRIRRLMRAGRHNDGL